MDFCCSAEENHNNNSARGFEKRQRCLLEKGNALVGMSISLKKDAESVGDVRAMFHIDIYTQNIYSIKYPSLKIRTIWCLALGWAAWCLLFGYLGTNTNESQFQKLLTPMNEIYFIRFSFCQSNWRSTQCLILNFIIVAEFYAHYCGSIWKMSLTYDANSNIEIRFHFGKLFGKFRALFLLACW